MATVKIACPLCAGTGLVGSVTESVCPDCKGSGTQAVNDQSTFATVNTSLPTAAVITAPKAIPTAALKVAVRGK